MNETDVTFEPVDEDVGLLKVTRAGGLLTPIAQPRGEHDRGREPWRCDIGGSPAPVILHLSGALQDDGFRFQVRGLRLPVSLPHAAVPGGLVKWFKPHALPPVQWMLDALPRGDYWLVKSKLPQRRPARDSLNIWIEGTEGVSELFQDEQLYAIQLCTDGANPVDAAVLLGVSLIGCTESEQNDSIWFLALSDQPHVPQRASDAPRLLVVPATGALVLNHDEWNYKTDKSQLREAWVEHRSPRAARLLIG